MKRWLSIYLAMAITFAGIVILSISAKAVINPPAYIQSGSCDAAASNCTVILSPADVGDTVLVWFWTNHPSGAISIDDTHPSSPYPGGNVYVSYYVASGQFRLFNATVAVSKQIDRVKITQSGASSIAATVGAYRNVDSLSHANDFSSSGATYSSVSTFQQSSKTAVAFGAYGLKDAAVTFPAWLDAALIQNHTFPTNVAIYQARGNSTTWNDVDHRLAITLSWAGGGSALIIAVNLLPKFSVSWIDGFGFCGSPGIMPVAIPQTWIHLGDELIVFGSISIADKIFAISDGGDVFSNISVGVGVGNLYLWKATYSSFVHTQVSVSQYDAGNICLSLAIVRGGTVGNSYFQWFNLQASSINRTTSRPNSLMLGFFSSIGNNEAFLPYRNNLISSGQSVYDNGVGFNTSVFIANLSFGIAYTVTNHFTQYAMVEILSAETGPTVQTLPATAVDFHSATIWGNLVSLGSEPNVSVGLLLSESPSMSSPTNYTLGSKTVADSFHVILSFLDLNTTYYFKAWAISSFGYINSSILNFTTLDIIAPSIPQFPFIVFFIVVVTVVLLSYRFMTWRRSRGRRS